MSFTSEVASGQTMAALNKGNHRKLCLASDGRIWCVYIRRISYYRIYVSYSDDNGITWTEEQVNDEPSSNYTQDYPSIAIDSNDDIRIVWRGRGFGIQPAWDNILYRKRVNSTGNWDSQELITNTNPQYVPSIAIDSSDNAHVVWEGLNWGANTTVRNIQYSKRVSSSADWANNREALTDMSVRQGPPNIAIDSSDQPHVFWAGLGYGNNPAKNNFQYRVRTDSWQAREPVSDISNGQQNGAICIDSNDVPHVVWEGPGWAIFDRIVYSSRTGGTWSAGAMIDDDITYNQGGPSISVDSLDDIHVVWEEDISYDKIYYTRKTSSGWGASILLVSREGFNQFKPSLLWAKTPSSAQLTSGFAFVWSGSDAGGATVEYYRSYDIFPSDPRTRITELVHRFDAYNTTLPYSLEVLLGGATQGSLTVLSKDPTPPPEITEVPASAIPSSAIPSTPGQPEEPVMEGPILLGLNEEGKEMWLTPDGKILIGE